MRYRDFVLQIGPAEDGGFAVEVLDSPAGEARGRFVPPAPRPAAPAPPEAADGQAGEGRDTRRLAPPVSGPDQEAGAALFDALFAGDVGKRYQYSLGMLAQRPGVALRLKLRFDLGQPAAARLHRLPWELLFQPDTADFLALDGTTSIVRHLEVPRPLPPPELPERLRVLAVAASPDGLPPLNVAGELDRIRRAVAGLARVEVVALAERTLAAARRALREGEEAGRPFHALHFAGHGDLDEASGAGFLVFEGAGGAPDRVEAEGLAAQLKGFAALRLVVLNACHGAEEAAPRPYAGVAAALVRGGVPAVLAMRERILDAAAVAFSAAFYEALARGETLDAAVIEGRLAVRRAPGSRPFEWSLPALFMRLADGRLFESVSPRERYLARLRERLTEVFPDLLRPDRVYVPQFAAPAGEEGGEVDLAGEMESFWRERPRRLAVLGNYGMGKTYLAGRTIYEQIERAEAAEEAALPVLYRLRLFNYGASAGEGRRLDLIDQIHGDLLGMEFPLAGRRDLVRALEDGAVGLVLDGLDELHLPPQVSWTSVLAPVLDLGGVRLCLTSRPAYLDDPARDLTGFALFELLEWSEREWSRLLELSEDRLAAVDGRDRFHGEVGRRPQLSQLTTRPLWCHMIIELAATVVEVEDLGLTALYQRFIDHAIQRRADDTRFVLSMAWRYCAMERIAETCLSTGVSSLPEDRLMKLLSELFETLGDDVLQAYLLREARTYAFLNCSGARDYSFGHASFADYFAASAAARRLLVATTGFDAGPKQPLRPDPPLETVDLEDDLLLFLAGMVREQAVARALRLLDPKADFTRVYSGLLQRLEGALSGERGSRQGRRNLFRLYLLLRRGDAPGRPAAVRGLVLAGLDLAGEDLSGCDLDGVDFADCNLARTSFAGSRLGGCSFFGATLDGADFSGADLAGADFTGIDPPTAPPRLDGARGLEEARMDAEDRRFFRPGEAG